MRPSVFLLEMTRGRSRVFFRGSVPVSVLEAALAKSGGLPVFVWPVSERYAPKELLQAFASALSSGLPEVSARSAEESAGSERGEVLSSSRARRDAPGFDDEVGF